jgi:hypothetical protein
MKRFFCAIPLAGLLLIQACSSAETPAKTAEKQAKTEVKAPAVVPNKMLALEIDGMVCKMGCGGSIRKELKATGAVANCEFDFVEERQTNTLKVEFDKTKITADQIVEIISTMNEKQFTVGKTTTTDLSVSEVSNTAVDESANSIESEKAKIKVTEPSFEFPNLLKLLSRIMQ